MDHLQKANKGNKSIKKQEIHDISIKTNYINLVLKTTWLIWLMDFKDLNRRTASDKILCDKFFLI